MAEAPERVVVRDDELTKILHGMQDRRAALARGATWSVAGQWRSFKADFVHATSAEGDLAVKFGDGWTPDDAHFVSAEVERVRTLFKQLPGGKVRVPRALGWSESPAAVALGYVDGDMLFSALPDRSHRIWNRGQAGVVETMASCGQALGAYHSAEPATGDPAITKVALGDLLSAARRAGVRRTTILALEPRLERARGYRFSPNDFIIDAQGRLVMLDPPHVRKYDYLQRDVSAFTFELHRSLIGVRPTQRNHPNGMLLKDLRRAFLDGYSATGPSSLGEALDVWMIRLFEVSRITGCAYASLRRRSFGKALPALAWAAQERRHLGSPPRAQELENGSISP
jgi:hypothetical protein